MDSSEHINEFRYVIQKLKRSIIQNRTLESQNISALRTVLEPELNKLFLLLRPIIENYKPVSTIPDEDLQNLFYRTLQEYPRTPTYQNELIYYLYRDLIEYPLIIDTNVIDDYINKKNRREPIEQNGMPDIVENNNSLTIE
jgi:hypothetical protein